MKIINNSKHSDTSIQLLLNWKPYTKWLNNFHLSKCILSSIILQGAVFKSHDLLYSALIEINFFTPENQNLTRSILLRGAGCVVIPYFYNSDGINFLLVKQRRVQNGEYSLEFPSGKIEDELSTHDSAALELFEETGIRVSRNNLCLLASKIVVCESAFDEVVTWFSCQIDEREYLANLENTHGLSNEGEHITITSLSLNYLKKISSFQVKTGLQLLLEHGIIDL